MTTINKPARLSESGCDFISEERFHNLLHCKADSRRVDEVLDKSLALEPLTVEETAVLIAAGRPEEVEKIFAAARQLKERVYGKRIVLFAPLYVGNHCVNDCRYCAFRRSNRQAVRRTLTMEELRRQVAALEQHGHKRLILVFGEHPRYHPEFIAACVREVYAVREGRGEIRRININAAPLDHEGFKTVKAAGIGTYQIFQETYHYETYQRVHPPGTPKADYRWRLDGVSRAMEAGCDDVGIGALFGLYDWRFEVLSLVSHALHLQKHYHCGPHTISIPRLRPAQGVHHEKRYLVSDGELQRIAAILRLAVPYTGLILTAREPPHVRRAVVGLGVSQIDAGSRIELAGYTEAGAEQSPEREQFELGDLRSLEVVVRELLDDGYLPSFCTACYRVGRTGAHFMEFAIPGFIQNFCTPNGLSTLLEYLCDYASPETRTAGEAAIRRELENLPDGTRKQQLRERLSRIAEQGERDLYF